MTPRHLAFIIFINLVWGLGVVITKVIIGHFPPFMLSGLRATIIILAIWPALTFQRGKMKDILLIAACAGPINFGLGYVGMALSSASVAAVVSQMGVPFATILSVIFLKEHIGWRRGLGIAFAFIGIVIITFDPSVFGFVVGIMFILGSVLAWAVGAILQRRLKDVGVYELQSWIALVTVPSMLAASLAFESNHLEIIRTASLTDWAGCFYLAFGATLIGHAGMYYLFQRYDVSLVAPLTLLSPLFAIALSVLLLGDVLTPLMVLGSVITLLGVLIISLRQKRVASLNP